MAIGSAVVLFALGAILAYAVDVDVAGLDIRTMGVILMATSVVGGLIGLAMHANRTRTRRVAATREVHRTPDGGQVVHTEQEI